jgi:hypothetical protein
MPELKHWESFYVIVGAAAGALIGLQFVVMTLLAERPSPRAAEAEGAFATPTIVHFGAAFFLSALVSAPWHAITTVATLLGITGLMGTVYMIIVARRMGTQRAYPPHLEDWAFHVLLPLVAYVTLAVSAFAVPSNEHDALFGVGGAALLLVYLGIYNSWDSITFLVRSKRTGKKDA